MKMLKKSLCGYFIHNKYTHDRTQLHYNTNKKSLLPAITQAEEPFLHDNHLLQPESYLCLLQVESQVSIYIW